MVVQIRLDDDVEGYVTEQSIIRAIPFDQALNEIVRRDMGAEVPFAIDAGARKPFKVVPFSSGLKPGITPENLKEVAAEIELEDMARKLAQ